jgi:hypothetical protein
MVVVEIFDDLCSVVDGFQTSVVGDSADSQEVVASPSFLARPARDCADATRNP